MGKYSLYATKEDYRLAYEELKALEKSGNEQLDWKKIKTTSLDNLHVIAHIMKRKQAETDLIHAIRDQKQEKLAEQIKHPTPKLTEYQFKCDKCNKIHEMSTYAIAQRSMNVALIFNCPCGHKIDI